MKHYLLILSLFTFSQIFSQDCDNGYIEIEGFCFHQGDIVLIQEILDNSVETINMYFDDPGSWFWNIIDGNEYYFANGNGVVEPLEIGLQEWNNGRLTSLMCGAYIYCQLSGEIPNSISNLSEIQILRLELNYFTGEIPESVCELENMNFNDVLSFDFSYNQLCPPYPECVPEIAVNYMDISECYSMGDLNSDGEIDILDIVELVNIILGLTYENPAGDLNQDGLYDVLDIIQLVNIILNQELLPEECYIVPEVGPCDGICPTYFYNQNTNQCEEFITGCCGVEAFNTLQDCQNSCE